MISQIPPEPEVTQPCDAKVASSDGFTTMLVTSPNQDWVPVHPVDSTVIKTYSNGLWGLNEYSRWPQPLTTRTWHHACIPISKPGEHALPPVTWAVLSPTDEYWEPFPEAHVQGMGFLKAHLRMGLTDTAREALGLFQSVSDESADYQAYGQELALVLKQCVDRMTRIPSPRTIAVAVGAHIQRVSLELAGLVIYLRVVRPRLQSGGDYSHALLRTVGTFVTDAATAGICTRVGLPVWFLQPPSPQMKIWRVVRATEPTFTSRETGPTGLEYDPTTLGGIINDTGRWAPRMAVAISRQLCAATLPLLTDSDDLRSKELHLPRNHPGPQQSAYPDGSSKTRRWGKKMNGFASSNATDDGGLVSVSNLHDGLTTFQGRRSFALSPNQVYSPSPFYTIPPVWIEILKGLDPLPHPLRSSLYFYPPPFLLDTIPAATGESEASPPCNARLDRKVHRYLHNLVRIREFCRLRLLDPSISGCPLTIREWRAALWGDYGLHQAPSKTSGELRTVAQRRTQLLVERKCEAKNAIARLCANTAALSSYDPKNVTMFAGVSVTLDAAINDPRVRLALCWEAHEINFRCEVIALDSVVVPRDGWTAEYRWARENLISGIWGPPSSVVTVLPSISDIGRPSWTPPGHSDGGQSCAIDFRAFLDVMSRWLGIPESLLRWREQAAWTADDLTIVQQEAVRFYTMTFISRFHRLPITPMLYPQEYGTLT